MKASLDACVVMQDFKEAAVRANNLSELHLTLGNIAEAMAIGKMEVRPRRPQ